MSVKCPKCSAEIERLDYSDRCTRGGHFFIGGGFEVYEEQWAETDSLLFFCPECEEILFEDDQDAAIKFLKG